MYVVFDDIFKSMEISKVEIYVNVNIDFFVIAFTIV